MCLKKQTHETIAKIRSLQQISSIIYDGKNFDDLYFDDPHIDDLYFDDIHFGYLSFR